MSVCLYVTYFACMSLGLWKAWEDLKTYLKDYLKCRLLNILRILYFQLYIYLCKPIKHICMSQKDLKSIKLDFFLLAFSEETMITYYF